MVFRLVRCRLCLILNWQLIDKVFNVGCLLSFFGAQLIQVVQAFDQYLQQNSHS